MMGRGSGGQKKLFYSFNLDDHVPADHLLRGIDRCLDLGDLRRHLAPFYSDTGRPSIDPELMVRMLIVGYGFGIRSERRLCEEVHLNLAYRWFCRLGLEDAVPEHSTFSKNRHGRFRESAAFRHVFESVVERCMKEGLVGGEGFAVDASVIKADANRSRSTAREGAEDLRDPRQATRAVREYLAALDEQGEPVTVPASISPTDPAARWTDAYKQSRKDRKKVEMLFAHLKRILRLDRLRLRGPNGAHDEFLLAAIAQNLRRMAKWVFSAEPEVTSMAT